MPSSACDWSSDVCSSDRSEEHTSELQSRSDLVCRLLLEKKKAASQPKSTWQQPSHNDISRRECYLHRIAMPAGSCSRICATKVHRSPASHSSRTFAQSACIPSI